MSGTAVIDTGGLGRCIGTLKAAFAHLQREGPDGSMRDILWDTFLSSAMTVSVVPVPAPSAVITAS